MINRHPYQGIVFRPFATDIESDSQGYKEVFRVDCDVTTKFERKDEIYNYTHEVWFWNDSKVVFNGVEMTWLDYSRLSDRVVLREGLYFEASFHDKNISGEIRLYSPSSMGVMLGIDTNRK